jgi:hypothetical protein
MFCFDDVAFVRLICLDSLKATSSSSDVGIAQQLLQHISTIGGLLAELYMPDFERRHTRQTRVWFRSAESDGYMLLLLATLLPCSLGSTVQPQDHVITLSSA